MQTLIALCASHQSMETPANYNCTLSKFRNINIITIKKKSSSMCQRSILFSSISPLQAIWLVPAQPSLLISNLNLLEYLLSPLLRLNSLLPCTRPVQSHPLVICFILTTWSCLCFLVACCFPSVSCYTSVPFVQLPLVKRLPKGLLPSSVWPIHL